MQLCRYHHPAHGARLGVVRNGTIHDATDIWPTLTAFLHWSIGRRNLVTDVAAALGSRDPLALLGDASRPPAPDALHLLRPTDEQEVWAAGVTYERSRVAREEESAGSGIYDRVYAAARPEIFFKATPSRVVGPYEAVAVRSDSQWNVPEPELALVINQQLELIGFTIGNDMSSRDIEGENPLYLPQAKVYARCCALGPVITLRDAIADPRRLMLRLTIERGGVPIFVGEISTASMVRTFEDLIAYLGRDNLFPQGVVLLTGTGIVPPDEVSLDARDAVTIAIEGIGELHNPVVRGG